MKPTKFFTARSTVIALFTAISVALLMASVLPQRASLGGKTPPWVERLPDGLHFLTTLLCLDNIVNSGWFAILVTFFWISLVISTVSQYKTTRALSSSTPSALLPKECTRLHVTEAAFTAAVMAAGYRPSGSSNGIHRYVKNRSGYWGNFLLHVGLVTAVFFSLVYVVTQHRVLIRLAGEEITRLSTENIQEMRGVLSQQQKLPYSVVLNTLVARFWGNDKLEHLSAELYFTDQPGGEPRRVNVALSDKSHSGPYIVYQANNYGRTFDLEFRSASGDIHRERLYLPYPPRRDLAGYGELALPGTDLLLKAKFYADTERKAMKIHNSPLTLRLYRGGGLQGEATLTLGATGQLGPFAVSLANSAWWTDIMLDGTRGTAGIFAGFALILAGVLSSYCLVPREIISRKADDGIYAQHVVKRFAHFYRDEFDEIIRQARITGAP